MFNQACGCWSSLQVQLLQANSLRDHAAVLIKEMVVLYPSSSQLWLARLHCEIMMKTEFEDLVEIFHEAISSVGEEIQVCPSRLQPAYPSLPLPPPLPPSSSLFLPLPLPPSFSLFLPLSLLSCLSLSFFSIKIWQLYISQVILRQSSFPEIESVFKVRVLMDTDNNCVYFILILGVPSGATFLKS